MYVASYSDARANLKAVIDRTINDADATLIHRKKGGNAVLMSEDHYNSLMETFYLLSNPANAKHLLASIEQDKNSQVRQFNLADLERLADEN